MASAERHASGSGSSPAAKVSVSPTQYSAFMRTPGSAIRRYGRSSRKAEALPRPRAARRQQDVSVHHRHLREGADGHGDARSHIVQGGAERQGKRQGYMDGNRHQLDDEGRCGDVLGDKPNPD
mmetsp:Transcript_53161/g.166378  ORF Transcript_53161/g.166378 Transcript_53161/m.166378 type:complete len:123 (-) Transcript_53161:465-833(-)